MSEWSTLSEEHVESVAPLLSAESARALREEVARVKGSMTCATRGGVSHLCHVPDDPEDASRQVRSLQERMTGFSRLCFLLEASEKSARREAEKLRRENEALQEQNASLQAEVERLKHQLGKLVGAEQRRGKRAPSPDSEADEAPSGRKPAPRKRGAPVGHRGNTRAVPDHVDAEEVVEPPGRCERCGSRSILPTEEFDEQYEEDIPPIVPSVTLRRYRRGRCAHCGQVVRSPEGAVGPPVKTGPNLAAHLAAMRQTMGLSYAKLAQFATEMLRIPLSPSGALQIVARLSDRLEGIYTALEAALPHQPVLHGDETGWKMDGQRWQLWCFCNPRLAYFHADPSRAAQVIKDRLGEDFAGVVHCDFYAAYNFLPHTQRCLIHLQRTIKEELALSPDDPFLPRLKADVATFIAHGKDLRQRKTSVQERRRRKAELDPQLQALIQLEPPEGAARTLVARLRTHRDSLLRFVEHPDVEFHNNRAERQLRPVVIFRKLSFGNRTPQGARRYTTLSSVVQTCRLQGRNVTDFLRRVLDTPPAQTARLARELLDTT